MRRGLILLLLAAAAAAGSPAEAHRRASGLAWTLSESADEGAKLTLGVPDTDDVVLAFACHPRSGRLRLTIVARQADGAAVELRSGKLRARYPGAGAADEETPGAYDIQVELNADDPILRRVSDTGELTVVTGLRRTRTPNAFAQFHDYLNVCRR